jgi:hypothetical protein
MVTIFKNPVDAPGFYVARRFNGSFATADKIIDTDINTCRLWAMRMVEKWNHCSAINMGRQSVDEPQIVETWV